ncbi:hypothetical protein ACFWF7_42275 [Nocardia sp. NPDC060256]
MGLVIMLVLLLANGLGDGGNHGGGPDIRGLRIESVPSLVIA